MTDHLPTEAEMLLSVGSEEFVGERQRLARELRDADRPADAAVVAKLRKPPPVVLAVNRAARARPKAARAAAESARRVKKAQIGADPAAFRAAVKELEESLELLADVALAHLARGKRPSASMRHRLRELLRNAMADDDARAALTRGVLRDETETAGFELFAGMAPAKRSRPSGDTARAHSRTSGEEKRGQREQALRTELARAEERLEEARRSVERAERERINAERAVASARAKLDRLD